jgi:hypothetical protein
MRSWTFSIASLALAAACLAPAPALAQDASVGGRGPRVRFHDRRPVMARGHPVFVTVDELAAFGDLDVRHAPPLEIRIEGDAEIIVLPDGSLRIVLDGEDDGEAE